MSQVTSTRLKTAPAAADDLAAAAPGGIWLTGAWTEILAATGGPAAVAGLVCSGSFLGEVEVDVGAGAAGSEVVVTTFRLRWGGSAFGGPFVVWLPAPVTGIASGARLAVRTRNGSSQSVPVALLYYENLDATASSALPTKSLPSAADGVSLTPNATAWANSGYTQLTAGLGNAISLLGITFTTSVANVEGEWDLASGPAGAETVLTTLRFASPANSGAGGINNILLPAPYPIPASTRVAVRLRKSGTSTTTYTIALLYDESTGAPDAITGSGAVAIGAPALSGSGTATLPALTGTGAVTVGAPALSGTGDPIAVFTRSTQVVVEVLNVVPASPLHATQVAAEIVLALPPQPNEARVTQLACELIVVRAMPGGCVVDFPTEDAPAADGCSVIFPVLPV